MRIKDLKHNVKNPRKITSEKKAQLLESIKKFGDLGGIVFNKKTEKIVSGHQRTSVIPSDAKIVINKKYETPTSTGTIAEGHIEYNGEKYSYREVYWDEKSESEALLSANKSGGEWDFDLLKILVADVPDLDLGLAGFNLDEISFILPPATPKSVEEKPQTDEQYVRDTPETTEQIPTENPNENVKFENTEEKTKVDNKRYVIIIDCKDQEAKDSLREKLKPLIEEAQAKIF